MTEGINGSVQNDVLYHKMQACFQAGEWDEGLDLLSKLNDKYPLETELWPLMNDMQVRSNIDKDEKGERRHAALIRGRNIAIRVSIAAVIIFAVFWVLTSSASWIESRVAIAAEELESDRQTIEFNSKFTAVQQYLLAYRPDEAEKLLDEIKVINPEYPGMADLYEIVYWQQSLLAKYDEAMSMKVEGDYEGALLIFEAIDASQPRFRDVYLQISEIQREFGLEDLLGKAEIAIDMGDWESAIAYIDDIRNLNLFYEQEFVEEMLYMSYINQARDILDQEPASVDILLEAREYYRKALAIRPQDVNVFEELQISQETVADRLYTKYMELAKEELAGQADSKEALNAANDYYSEALKIRPDDPVILREQTLAQTYLEAVNDVSNEYWSPAITKLMFIYEQDADYASGTAAQMLYDAYVARGDNFLFTGRAKSALDDYQEAVAIAEHNPESLIQRFEVQVRIGDVYGVIGNYENAVHQYRAALELAGIDENVVLDAELLENLQKADNFAVKERYESAYRLYNVAMPEIANNFQTYTHVVQSGDYLSQLANYYQTTLSAILEANQIRDPNDISIGVRIIIPVIP